MLLPPVAVEHQRLWQPTVRNADVGLRGEGLEAFTMTGTLVKVEATMFTDKAFTELLRDTIGNNSGASANAVLFTRKEEPWNVRLRRSSTPSCWRSKAAGMGAVGAES
jgi:hypothetical protein